MAFDKDYERWVDEQKNVINNLRTAFNSEMEENNNHELHAAILAVTSHYDELFRLKSIGTKADVFHMLSGSWKTPGETCFMWLGGFRSSELIKMMREQFEALTEEKFMAIYSLEQCSLQAEDALSQGMEALRQPLLKSLSPSASLDVVAEHNMDQMALAVSHLHSLEALLLQADLLRQQTLNQLQGILTMQQLAQAFLVINDYISRLRNLKCGCSIPKIIESN